MKVALTFREMNELNNRELLERLEYAIKNGMYHDYIVSNLMYAVENRMNTKSS